MAPLPTRRRSRSVGAEVLQSERTKGKPAPDRRPRRSGRPTSPRELPLPDHFGPMSRHIALQFGPPSHCSPQARVPRGGLLMGFALAVRPPPAALLAS